MPNKSRNTKKVATPQQLNDLRREADQTQPEAAEMLYVSLSTYQNWEYGDSRCPYAYYELYELKCIARGLIKRGTRE